MEQADEDNTTGSLSPTTRDEAISRLETIQRGLTTFGHLVYGFPIDERVEVGPDGLAAVIHVFGFALDGTLNLLAPRAQEPT